MSFCLPLAALLMATASGCKEDAPPKSAGDTLKSREPSIMKALDKFEAPEPDAPDKTSDKAPPASSPSTPGQTRQPPAAGPK